jgi:hypothetical protein
MDLQKGRIGEAAEKNRLVDNENWYASLHQAIKFRDVFVPQANAAMRLELKDTRGVDRIVDAAVWCKPDPIPAKGVLRARRNFLFRKFSLAKHFLLDRLRHKPGLVLFFSSTLNLPICVGQSGRPRPAGKARTKLPDLKKKSIR